MREPWFRGQSSGGGGGGDERKHTETCERRGRGRGWLLLASHPRGVEAQKKKSKKEGQMRGPLG